MPDNADVINELGTTDSPQVPGRRISDILAFLKAQSDPLAKLQAAKQIAQSGFDTIQKAVNTPYQPGTNDQTNAIPAITNAALLTSGMGAATGPLEGVVLGANARHSLLSGPYIQKKIKDMWGSGMTQREIAENLNEMLAPRMNEGESFNQRQISTQIKTMQRHDPNMPKSDRDTTLGTVGGSGVYTPSDFNDVDKLYMNPAVNANSRITPEDITTLLHQHGVIPKETMDELAKLKDMVDPNKAWLENGGTPNMRLSSVQQKRMDDHIDSMVNDLYGALEPKKDAPYMTTDQLNKEIWKLPPDISKANSVNEPGTPELVRLFLEGGMNPANKSK